MNCILYGNSTPMYGNVTPLGGGAIYALLENCIIRGNSTGGFGGGANNSTLVGCTVVGNTAGRADLGGGVAFCYVTNSIVYFNNYDNILSPPGYRFTAYCCTTPLPTDGNGNITSPPQFVDQAGGDLRLQPSSPCINAGDNIALSVAQDFAGSARVAGGAVDIGAYEFQSATSLLSYAWAQEHGLPTDGSADFTDPDGDGMKNYNEWRSDTDPTSPLSVLRILTVSNSFAGAGVTWQSVATRSYWVERAVELGLATPFQVIATDITGVAGSKTFNDSSATNTGPYFFRVGVH